MSTMRAVCATLATVLASAAIWVTPAGAEPAASAADQVVMTANSPGNSNWG